MKKGISKNKVQRMRNLVTGDYSNKTSIQSGYGTKSKTTYSEGDTWEERGKTWTIKNGIKQTVTKLDTARAYTKIPLHCPKCSTKMTKEQHKFMYIRFNHCLFCQTKDEQRMRDEGTYDAWKKDMITKNFQKALYKTKEEFKDWLQTRKSKKAITEAGLIEDWTDGKSDEELLAEFDIYITNESNKIMEMTK